jgi:hypothetical protein
MTKLDERVEALQQIPWFQELKPEHVKKLASMTELRSVKAGDVLSRRRQGGLRIHRAG